MAQQNKSKTSEENKKWLWNNITLFLAILCLIMILWKPLISAINIIFVSPILQHIYDNCWAVMIALVLLEIIYYKIVYKKVSNKNGGLKRFVVASEIILLYLLFRLSNEYSFYGFGKTFPAYTDVVFIIVAIVEIVLYCNTIKSVPEDKNEGKYSHFLFDKPTDKDNLKRKGYAITLVEKIKSTFPDLPLEERKKNTNTSFTVLLSERYGQGKSSFFEQIKDICKSEKIDVIVFRPWLSNNPDHLIINYFDLLREKLGNYNKELRKLLQSYSVLASEHITGKVAKVASGLLNEGSIERQHDRISRILLEEGKLRIVLIDDVDRLQAEELLALIKLVRNTADFPYIAYVVAADKAAMRETLKSVGITEPEEYLKKFFNFELLFPADDNNIIDSLINNICAILRGFGFWEDDIKELSADINKNSDYYAPVFTNMRDVYRFCNILSFELDVLENQTEGVALLNDIYIADFVKVCIIQYLSPDLYKIFRDYWYALLKITGDDNGLAIRDDFEKYVNSREAIQKVFRTVDLAKAKLDIDFEGDLQPHKSNEDEKVEEPNTLPKVIDKASPQKTELIKYLLNDLWPDAVEKVDLRRIRYMSQYFMYFAGRYSKTELSDSEALLLFSLQGDDFTKKVSAIISQKKDSLIHKLNIIVENRSVDRLILLNNIMHLSLIDFQNYISVPEPLPLNYFEYYRIQQYTSIIQHLYMQQHDEKIERERLFETHKSFFKTCKQYAAGAFAIYAMRPFYSEVDGKYTSVFSKEQVDNLSKILIDSFYSEVFTKKPFGEKTIKEIPCIRVANNKYWDDLFVKYVRKYKNPMEWLFNIFVLNKTRDGLLWNSDMVLAVLGEYPKLDSFDVVAENLVGKDALNDYKQGMEYINPNHTDFSTIEKVNSKPFTKAAFEWLTTQSDKSQHEQKVK